MSEVKWLPLESNPEVMNKFLEYLGVPDKFSISDVISLDEELISLIPSSSLAFLLLFPVSPAHEEYSQKKNEEMKALGCSPNSNLYFMKQTIRNACGTVALIHAVSNNVKHCVLKEDSLLKKFLDNTKNLDPEERGKVLENNEDISAVHDSTAQEGQTEAPPINAEVNLHFIALVNVDGQLYELDGRRDFPVTHGSTSSETFVKDALKICREFISRDPENLSFTVLSFGPAVTS